MRIKALGEGLETLLQTLKANQVLSEAQTTALITVLQQAVAPVKL